MLLWVITVVAFSAVIYFALKSTQPSPALKIKDGTQKMVVTVKDVVDVNNDGKVNVKDAVQVAKNVKAEATRAKKKYGGKVKKKKSE
jgi:hypothetical protein